MIQPSTTTNVPGIARDSRRHDPAATAAVCTAGHRTPSAIAAGSPCPRRSAVLPKPAHVPGEPMAKCSDSCGAPLPAGWHSAKFLGVKHEGLFEISTEFNGGHSTQIVRVPFADGDYAEEAAPSLDRLLNSGNARTAAQHLRDVLTVFLDGGDGGESGVDVVKRAAAVLDAIEVLREEIEAD